MKTLVFIKCHAPEGYSHRFAMDCQFKLPKDGNGLVVNESGHCYPLDNVLGNFTQTEQDGDGIAANINLIGLAKEMEKEFTPHYAVIGSVKKKNQRGEATQVIIHRVSVTFSSGKFK